MAGESNYVLKVRTKTTSDLEELIRRLREKGEVQTRTTIVLSVPFEGRPGSIMLQPTRSTPCHESRRRDTDLSSSD